MNTSFISTQQVKDLVNEQKFTSTSDIMQCMKGMFADVLEQTLQAEMDIQLGYDHAQRRTIDGKKNKVKGGKNQNIVNDFIFDSSHIHPFMVYGNVNHNRFKTSVLLFIL